MYEERCQELGRKCSYSSWYKQVGLNCEGGSIYWGIRDSDRLVVGVKLDYSQRDEIRRITDEKLSSIQPTVSLSSFKITFQEVLDGNNPIKDLYVLQVYIPQIDSRDLYFKDKMRLI